MKNKFQLALMLILVVLLNNSFSIRMTRDGGVTSIDADTVKSKGNFLNIAPETKEIITPAIADSKLKVRLFTSSKKTDCKGNKVTSLNVKDAVIKTETKEFYTPDETKGTFGTSSIPAPEPEPEAAPSQEANPAPEQAAGQDQASPAPQQAASQENASGEAPNAQVEAPSNNEPSGAVAGSGSESASGSLQGKKKK